MYQLRKPFKCFPQLQLNHTHKECNYLGTDHNSRKQINDMFFFYVIGYNNPFFLPYHSGLLKAHMGPITSNMTQIMFSVENVNFEENYSCLD